eukprot:162621-Hanusia_phi.AAC.2
MSEQDKTDALLSSLSKRPSSRRSKKTSKLTLEYIQSLFVMRQKEAAEMLVRAVVPQLGLLLDAGVPRGLERREKEGGFSNTTMKHVCRKLGISKWPYSRVRPRLSTIAAVSPDTERDPSSPDE